MSTWTISLGLVVDLAGEDLAGEAVDADVVALLQRLCRPP